WFNSGSLQAAIAGNNVRKTLTVSNIISNANWISGNWNHITLVYTAPTITLYVNGISVGTTTHTISTIFNSTNPSAFGASRGQNAFNSAASSSYFAGFIDHVTVVKEAIATSLVPSFVKSCLQSDTTLSLTPKPAAPSNLVINGENTTSIAMSFNDNSGNETGFEIFRSVGDNSNYRYIKTLPANATAIVNYTDDELFANTIYYYIIRAINNGGNSAFTSEATTKTHNNMPNFNALPADSFVMHYSTTENLNIGATDLDGETLTLTVITTLPPFVSFNQTGNGTGQFTFINPDILQQGDFPMQVVVEDENTGTDTLNFILVVNDNNKPVPNSVTDVSLAEGAVLNVPVSATDAQGNTGLVWSVQSSPSFVSVNNGVDGNATVVLAPGFSFEGVHSIVLKVTDAGGAYSLLSFNATVTHAEPVSEVVYMNMENAAPVANAPWNNITNVVSTNLLNAVGANTGIGLNFSTGWWSTSGQGSITGDNSGVYPDNVIQDFFYGGVYGSPDTISITLTGLTVGTRYNVTMFGSSSWANFTNNGTTLYEYNGQSKSIDVQGNKNKTVSFGSIAPNGSGQLVLRMYKAPGSPIAVLNAMVLEKLVNDLSLPAMPENLVGEALSDAKVELFWKDKSYNENNFQVYRATNPAGPYILLNTGATNANDSVYVDNSTSSQTTYYYKIEATNDNGSSGLTNFVEVKSTNRLPVLQTINDIVVQGGGSANVNISGTDPGDVLNLSVSGLPSFAVFTPTGNGTGSISINPGTNDVGTYNNISVILTDNNAGKTEETFSIIVTDPSVRNVYINFGPQGSPAAHTPWNNVLTYPFTNYVVSNLIDDANTNSGFSIRLVDGWEGNQSAGMYTGYNSGIYPDNVMQSSIHVTDALEHNIEISGLNPSMRYNIVGFSSHDAGISSSMTMKSGASSVVLEGMYNDVKSVQINNLTPNGSGVLTVSFKKTTSDLRYLNLNALIIQEVDPAFISSSIVRPFNLMAETLLDSTQIKLTWSDQSSNEAGFELYRATSQYGSYSLIATLSAGVTTYTNTGLSPNVRYFYKIRSYRGSGLSRRNSDYSNIATEVLSPRIVYININVESAMNASAPWNNLNSPAVEGATFPDLNDNKTFNSGVEMEITKEFNGTGYGGVNSNSGIFPSLVMQSNYWSDANQLSQVKFKNLNINKRYRIGIFGSAIFFGYAIANYTCNGHTVQLNSYNNSTKIVYLDNLQPDDNGELVLSVITAPDQPYTFTGAFTIESYNAYDNYTPISTNKQADETEPASENAPGEIINNANSNQHPVAQVEKGMQQTVAIKEDKGAINVYPNPFTNKIEVEVNEVKADNISILLYDVNARLIYKSTPFKPISGRNVIQVNLPGGVSLTPGNYVLNVLFDGKPAKTVKLVKIR
ncbi:MAG: LamG-like jellyroll fold domain-containing protein, partial [Ferruginibacter sp.]